VKLVGLLGSEPKLNEGSEREDALLIGNPARTGRFSEIQGRADGDRLVEGVLALRPVREEPGSTRYISATAR
jgi:hypothetical protein